ncbi:uncharacterized protein BCR38DRAFT_481492 [Pseudomassariella vexata]|uniref:Uncharacterized protein n=1 Tax=Pseudomassariella vexata TaxID=1141098 RepID=A0A1Y2EFM4_9PEZI|nr:uncharacterized protein BCR38DRAFT_481492 [Pseudomassariella vexata]ORY70359.1 hypothetical protein BCR38DRAFT_481492 [Pseudomassariella vexata]
MSIKRPLNHITEHMEELSIFSLPKAVDGVEGQDVCGETSRDVLDDDVPSLQFSSHTPSSSKYEEAEKITGRRSSLQNLVQGQPNEALIRDLHLDKDSEPSQFLKRTSNQFAEVCKGQYRVISFYELQKSPILERTSGTQSTGGALVTP